MPIHAPLNSAPIEAFWVFLSNDGGGDGIVSTSFGDLMLPLVSGSEEVVEMMKLEARRIAKFTVRENVWNTADGFHH